MHNLIGVPFVNGGRDLTGMDCYGLAQWVFKKYGIDLPDYKISCEDATRIDCQIAEAKPNWIECRWPNVPVPALVVMRFNSPIFCNHTGVYIGGGRFIHTRERVGVNIDRIESPVWRRRIEGFYIPGWVNYDKFSDTKKSV
ncbi:MAG: C40 family peptidase [Negativicutes bacterium]|nr:C40 family peptidase [Negativicutes bacterium]